MPRGILVPVIKMQNKEQHFCGIPYTNLNAAHVKILPYLRPFGEVERLDHALFQRYRANLGVRH